MAPGNLIHDVFPGNSTIDSLHCNDNNFGGDNTLDWHTDGYAFGEEYAVWGWARSEANCDRTQVLFRFVIDTPSEGAGSGSYVNSNY